MPFRSVVKFQTRPCYINLVNGAFPILYAYRFCTRLCCAFRSCPKLHVKTHHTSYGQNTVAGFLLKEIYIDIIFNSLPHQKRHYVSY